MESLVSYGSDDEGSENYLDMKDSMQRGMERLERPGGDDTNYDNVQMDMSEDSNNNNSSSESSSEDEKSSARSSSSASSASGSGGSSRRINLSSLKDRSSSMNKKSPTPSLPKDPKSERDDRRLRESPKGNDRPSKIDFDKDHRRDRQDSRDLIKHSSSREKERSRYLDRPNRDKSGRSERDRRSRSHDRRSVSHERQSKSQSRKDFDIRSGGSSEKDRERGRRSKSRDRQRSHSRDRRSRSRDQRRSRSRDRRSRSRDRRSRSRDRPIKDGHRRRGYDKKPNKLTVLERLGIELRAPEVPPAVTPQQLLQRSIEAQVQQVKSNTGIELPKYYNPAAMNPARYAEQMQKRKLLWGNKSTKTETTTVDNSKPVAPASNNKWEGTTFAQDQDGKMTAKFKRLMGIKDPAPSGGASSSGANGTQNPEGSDILKKQEELFNSMEMQYEVARVATHTHRGLGLGFGTFQYPR